MSKKVQFVTTVLALLCLCIGLQSCRSPFKDIPESEFPYLIEDKELWCEVSNWRRVLLPFDVVINFFWRNDNADITVAPPGTVCYVKGRHVDPRYGIDIDLESYRNLAPSRDDLYAHFQAEWLKGNVAKVDIQVQSDYDLHVYPRL